MPALVAGPPSPENAAREKAASPTSSFAGRQPTAWAAGGNGNAKEGPSPSNLPLQLTRFFGREAEIARLCRSFDSPPASQATSCSRRRTDLNEEPPDRASVPLSDLCVSSEAGGDFPRLV